MEESLVKFWYDSMRYLDLCEERKEAAERVNSRRPMMLTTGECLDDGFQELSPIKTA